ncbi:hypothetical protein EG68_02717 [Paragonimus skrjabini miyazakii]|uniref:CUB domain-containing protein n=1 Tax=Paragonimus skrjabini miyazakii TaxID=59628 RepID=A0A8S9Z384_9TREM|nr:hypothetical protein EG68_02717 [Paragonimus skrjabini miyazakii]
MIDKFRYLFRFSGQCGSELKNPSGSITQPWYNASRTVTLDCDIVITVPPNMYVQLTVGILEVKSGHNSVVVYEKNPPYKTKLPECPESRPPCSYLFRGNQIRLRLSVVWDYYSQLAFFANYTAVRPTTVCLLQFFLG